MTTYYNDLPESLSESDFTFQLFSTSGFIFLKMTIARNDFIIIVRFIVQK